MVKGLKLADFKKSNLWVTVVVLGVIVLLLFIPDLIGFDTSIAKNPTKFSLELPRVSVLKQEAESPALDIRREESPAPQAKSESDEAHSQGNPVEQLSYLVKQGYIDYEGDKAQSNSAKLVDTPKISSQVTPPSPANGEEKGGEKSEFIPRDRITWDQLKSKSSQKVLDNAENKIVALARRMPSELPQSRYALLNLVSGMDKVQNDADGSMSAREAVEYLEHLDLTVTRTMMQEGAPRADLVEWSEISISPILGSGRAERFKTASRPNFNPKPTLEEVALVRVADSRGRFDPAKPAFVRFQASLEGRDILRAELFHDGVFVKGMPLLKDPRVKNLFHVYSGQRASSGVYELRVTDKFGGEYVKYYSFAKPSTQVRWTRSRPNMLEAVLRGNTGAVNLDLYFAYRRNAPTDGGFFSDKKQNKTFTWWS